MRKEGDCMKQKSKAKPTTKTKQNIKNKRYAKSYIKQGANQNTNKNIKPNTESNKKTKPKTRPKTNKNAAPNAELNTKPKRKWINRVIWSGLILVFISMIGLLVMTLYVKQKLIDLPTVDAQYLNTYEPTRIFDNKEKIIWQPTDHRVKTVKYEEIPEMYKTALLVTEDENFWTNKGFSISGVINMLGGVVYSKLNPKYIPRGGSTIDQQLIKNRYYNGGKGHETTTRKIQELFLAKQLDENFTKKEILTFYVNSLSYAEGATGVKAIFETYFGKSPADYKERTPINIAEQAYIAGLSQAPSKYNLYENPKAANGRKNTVLMSLYKAKKITNKEYQAARAYNLSTGLLERFRESQQQRQQNLKYKAYTDEVLKEIRKMGYVPEDISLMIHTYLDTNVYDSIANKVREEQYYLDAQQQMAVTVMTKEGIVIGMVGSRKAEDELNRAVQNTRSSGSSMKPFTAYGPLLQYLGDTYNTSSLFDTSDYVYPGTSKVMYNWGRYSYGVRSMKDSLRLSLNTVVGRIDDELLGSERMKIFLHGLNLDIQDTYSAGDGIGLNISTLQSAGAYNALNNLGTYIEPRFINTIKFTDGSETIVEPHTKKSMNASTAWVLNHMLRGVPQPESTADAAAIPQYEGYAGKTGTVGFAENVNPPAPYGVGASDAWYSSYTNNGYTISIWTGYDEPNKSPQIPDTYKGYQQLNKDLQLLLNKKNQPPNWDKPDTVKILGGSGLAMDVAITDAKDTGTTSIGLPPNINYQATQIYAVTPSAVMPKGWPGNEKDPFYKYYEDGEKFPLEILPKDLYLRLPKGGNIE